MDKFIPVQYKTLNYPFGINPKVGEIQVNFGINEKSIETTIKSMPNTIIYYSLHTQDPYSLPQDLWSGSEWLENLLKPLIIASEHFKNLKIDIGSTKVIELHPPKKHKGDKAGSIDTFVEKLQKFYDYASKIFPEAKFVVENSNGNGLLLSSVEEINEFSKKISALRKDSYEIGIALDIPQLLYATELRCLGATKEKISDLFKSLEQSKQNITSIHLSGARGEGHFGHSHRGDLNTLFDHGDSSLNPDDKKRVAELKQSLLKGIFLILSDENRRYFVPELIFGSEEDKNKDLKEIVNDLIKEEIQFNRSPLL